MIEITNLHIHYGAVRAVEGLSLKIGAGQLVGLLGPNGAGKSSTLSCVAGLQMPTRGEVRVDGVDPVRDPCEVQKLLGFAPQDLALYPSLTVKDNLKVFGGLLGLSGRRLRSRIEWALAVSKLERHHRARVETLSGGMKRRLNLVAALLHDPSIIVCDEPTTGVDPQSRAHLFETIRALHAEGRTVVYTTHYMEEVEALCSHVAIIDQGRLIAYDLLTALIGSSEECTRFIVTTEGPSDAASLRAQLEAGGGGGEGGVLVREIRPTPRRLEDTFLELTGRALRDP